MEGLFWRFEDELEGAFRGTVVVRLDGVIEDGPLRVALQQLQQRHPKLRSGVALESDQHWYYRFETLPGPIPFEIKDFDEAEMPWRDEARRLTMRRFSPGEPLAAVAVLRSRTWVRSELFLTASHAIADGVSAIMLVGDLLTEYAKAEEQPNSPLGSSLPAITALRATSSGGWGRRIQLLHRSMRLQREEKRMPLTQLPENYDIAPLSQWAHWVFSPGDTLALIRRCRKEQTSMSGAMVAAVFCGLMDCLSVPEASFKCLIPFDIREFLEGSSGPVTTRDLGCFACAMSGLVSIKKNPSFWDVARLAHRDIQNFVDLKGPSFIYNLGGMLVDFKAMMRRLLRKQPQKWEAKPEPRPATLLATNYGVLDLRDRYGSLRPRECTLTFNNGRVGPLLIMESLVMRQQLNLGFACGGLEPEFWEKLQVAVRGYLDAAIANRGASSKAASA